MASRKQMALHVNTLLSDQVRADLLLPQGMFCVLAYLSVVTIEPMQHTRQCNRINEFGVIYNRLTPELIFRVTHWQDEEVKAEVRCVDGIRKGILNAV
jgi:hypothetical protein